MVRSFTGLIWQIPLDGKESIYAEVIVVAGASLARDRKVWSAIALAHPWAPLSKCIPAQKGCLLHAKLTASMKELG